MSDGPIRFYFDFISPYAYLAWTQIGRLADEHGRQIVAVPVLFAGLLNANGQKGPAEIPRKKLYMMKDCLRSARRLDVRFGPPPSHPFNPLLALRVASLDMEDATRRDLVARLFDEVWSGSGRGVTDPKVVAEVASAAGLDGEKAIEAANQAENKDRVRARTDEALGLGLFGVPTIEADGELYWGLDALANLRVCLEGNEALDAELLARWQSLPTSATR